MTTDDRGRVRIEPTAKRIRARVDGVTIADSTGVLMVWEVPYYPTYYFPPGDVRLDLMDDSGETERSPSRGTARVVALAVGDRTIDPAARIWDDAAIDAIDGYVSLNWKAMDQWFEEDEEVYVHPRDPYTRIDILQSSRRVRIEVDGVTLAESDRPRILFETGLPPRYYLPKTDVDFARLTPTDTETHCPYKGTARYWSATVDGGTHEDLAWGYDTPLRESQQVAGYVCFYDERVDTFIDDELRERPDSPFS